MKNNTKYFCLYKQKDYINNMNMSFCSIKILKNENKI